MMIERTCLACLKTFTHEEGAKPVCKWCGSGQNFSLPKLERPPLGPTPKRTWLLQRCWHLIHCLADSRDDSLLINTTEDILFELADTIKQYQASVCKTKSFGTVLSSTVETASMKSPAVETQSRA